MNMATKFRIMFLRDSKNQPVGCVAIGLTRSQKNIKYQVSVLNPIDQFDRSLARQIALGRLVESPFTVALTGDVDMHQISLAVMRDLKDNDNVPARANRAARRWLRT